MKRCVILLLLVLVLGSSLSAQESAKVKDIRRLLELTGSADMSKNMMESMIGSFRQSFPEIPGKFWDEFLKEVDYQELNELIIPIYDKYLKHSEILDLIKFYQSPTGRKFIDVMPQIQQESFVAGQSWGEDLSNRVILKMQEEGYY